MGGTPEPVELEIGVHANIGLVRPGDKLVIGVSRPITNDHVKDYEAYVARHLPGVEAVVICADSLAVYRPGDHQ